MVPSAMPRDAARSPPALLRSFAPIADARSRVLVLGTMPGPEALRKQEYYGFTGNHFWKIMVDLLAPGCAPDYAEKLALLRRHRIAAWDVLANCTREGAADSTIRDTSPNDIPGLLARHPGIHTIFCNGTTSARLFARFFGGTVAVPMIPLPSTSPAHATMPYATKRAHWTIVVAHAHTARPPAARRARAPR